MRPIVWTTLALLLAWSGCARVETDEADALGDLGRGGGGERDVIGVIDVTGSADTTGAGDAADADPSTDADCAGANLRADPDNCGRCGNRCDPPNGVGACIEGSCAIESCAPGFGDCDGVRVNGCETALSAPDGCRSCLGAGAALGAACGRCAGGVWRCDPGGEMVCAGEPEAGANACGGCGPLDAVPGEGCGTCGSGTWACSPPTALVCAGDLGPDAENACGECPEAGSCDPGEAESGAACPSGRPAVRLCRDDCTWGEWTCDPGGAVCAAGARESEDEACGRCAEGRRTRERTCAADGGSWSAWSAWSACASAAECAPGEVDLDTRACGGCGGGVQARERGCDVGTCQWQPFGPWSTCSGGGECVAGDTQRETRPCGGCGGSQERVRACDGSACAWGAWGEWSTCSSGAGECSPGDRRAGACADCLEQVCTASCTWSECQLASSSECAWERGSNWRCCATGWQFCLRSCRWSTDCAPCSGCGC